MKVNNDLDFVTITDENGQEQEMSVLFTYHNEETGLDYIVLYFAEEPEDPEEDLDYAFRYTLTPDNDGGYIVDLEEILDDEEYEMIDEVIEQYYEDLDKNTTPVE